uniref:Uncharacterized protein n=1 Tax=Moniliophthora roreri TaxID=221103 RepID=A0A0W0FFH4_MONRR
MGAKQMERKRNRHQLNIELIHQSFTLEPAPPGNDMLTYADLVCGNIDDVDFIGSGFVQGHFTHWLEPNYQFHGNDCKCMDEVLNQ